MPRRLALVALLLAAPAFAADPPNVVLIVADGLGARDLGCYGSTYYKTPHLDALAKQGVKLTDAYAAAPLVVPSRMAVLTGKHPARFGASESIPAALADPAHRLTCPPVPSEPFADVPALAVLLKSAGYVTDDLLTSEAGTFIVERAAKPFFLHLSIPADAKKDAAARYNPGKPGTQGDPRYAAWVEAIDDGVGEVLKALDDAKLTDKTIVVFTSTCGGQATVDTKDTPVTSNAPYRDGRGFLYDGGLRVPFIVRGPGIKGGVNVPVNGLDVAPTLLGLCGVKTDAKFDGRDLSAALTGGKQPDATPLFWHSPHYTPQGGRPGGAVRDGNWKHIEYFDSDRRELFDLAKDASESQNLIVAKPDVAKELAKKMADWRKAVGAKMPTPNKDYAPNPQAKGGTITLPGKSADAHGVQLRFEPMPHKNTLGFWTMKDDFLTFEFTVTAPGEFTVAALQGCGKGSGGATVELSVGDSKTTFTVKDTGGFQAFEPVDAGSLTIPKAGRHTLTVKATSKPGVAVMDLRELTLTPVKK